MSDCSFCGKFLESGTGKMYVEKEGAVYFYCSNKCEKNSMKLKRNPRKVKWTNAYHKEKAIIKAGIDAKKEKSKKEKTSKKGK